MSSPVSPLPAAAPGSGGRRAQSPAAAAIPAHLARPSLEAAGPCHRVWGLVSLSLPLSLHRRLPECTPSSHTWLRTCRTPLLARRSATSKLAFCTQTLWKAAGSTQPQVGTGRHLGAGTAPTEAAGRTGGPQSGPDTLRRRTNQMGTHTLRGLMHEKDGMYTQTKIDRQPLTGGSLLVQTHCPAQQQKCPWHTL